MMKHKFLFFIACFLVLTVNGQAPDIPMVNGVPTYSEIISTELPINNQYDNAKLWISKTFNSSKATIDLDDKENGKLILKAGLTWQFTGWPNNRSTDADLSIQLDFRENKYRYIIEVMRYQHSNTNNTLPELIDIANGKSKSWTNTKKYASTQLKELDSHIITLINELIEGMTYYDNF